MRRCKSLIVCLCMGASIAGLSGCSKPGTTAPPSVAAGSAAQVQKIERGKQYMTTLQGMPPDQRQAYIAAHPDLIQSVSTSSDPKLVAQLMEMTRRPGTK